jgi:hypothetical protein
MGQFFGVFVWRDACELEEFLGSDFTNAMEMPP